MKPAWDGWAWVCKIVPAGWKKYLGKKPSWVELAFNPEGAEESVPPTAIQIASAEHALTSDKLVDAVTTAIRERHAEQIGKRRLEDVVELQEVFVQPVEHDGVAFVGFGFSAEWDREHGLGVLTHGTRVLDLGGADVAFLTWMAQRHTSTPTAAPRKPAGRKPKPAARQAKPSAKKAAAKPKRSPKPRRDAKAAKPKRSAKPVRSAKPKATSKPVRSTKRTTAAKPKRR